MGERLTRNIAQALAFGQTVRGVQGAAGQAKQLAKGVAQAASGPFPNQGAVAPNYGRYYKTIQPVTAAPPVEHWVPASRVVSPRGLPAWGVGLRVDAENLHIDALDPPRIGKVGRGIGMVGDALGLSQPEVVPIADIVNVSQKGSRLDLRLNNGQQRTFRVANTVTTPTFSKKNAVAATDLRVSLESLIARGRALGLDGK